MLCYCFRRDERPILDSFFVLIEHIPQCRSLTVTKMASTTNAPFPLATMDPSIYGPSDPSGTIDNAEGASGSSPGAIEISHGGMVAIIVVVCVVAVLGSKSFLIANIASPYKTYADCKTRTVSMAVLFFVAKKREWRIRETLRRSARKVVTALTPRRTEFPKSVKESSGRASRGRVRLDDVPPTPRLRPEDIEKGYARPGIRQSPEGRSTKDKWPRK